MKIAIVGGGTSGWMTSFILSTIRKEHEYVNVSSSNIPIIGVGEGTTGKFLDIFRASIYDININQMMYEIDALPKLGIKFSNWSDNGDYYSPIDGSISHNYYIDYAVYSSILLDYPLEKTSVCGSLISNQKTNFYSVENNIRHDNSNHALHIDAYKTSEYFKKRSLQNCVTHIDNTIKLVVLKDDRISSLILDNGETITADFFIDCSGFSRVLSQNIPDTGWVDYSNHLLVDSAVTFSFEEDEQSSVRNEYTSAHAMNSGWVWEIPTRKKVGRGYIYSSKYASEDDIVLELKEKYQKDISINKLIEFKSGRVEKFINKNCLSLGLSGAFLEPLQATSIHSTIIQLEEFAYSFLSDDNLVYDEVLVENYNKRFCDFYDDIRDFIFVHYTGGRKDTEFWKHVSSITPPEQVQKILHFASTRLTRAYDFKFYYGAMDQTLWNYTLAGLGHFKKEVIQKVFDHDQVDLDQYLTTLKIHDIKIQDSSKRNLTADELNQIFLTGTVSE